MMRHADDDSRSPGWRKLCPISCVGVEVQPAGLLLHGNDIVQDAGVSINTFPGTFRV